MPAMPCPITAMRSEVGPAGADPNDAFTAWSFGGAAPADGPGRVFG
jgi:hypothetical protein